MSTSVTRSDDTNPPGYLYFWSPGTTTSIEEFVAKYKPSMIQNDGTKPWVWVRRNEEAKSPSAESVAAAVMEAAALLQEVTAKVEQINNNKLGTQSKKQVQTEAANKLKDISKKYGYTWEMIVSLASGSLAFTSAFCAKVSTLPENVIPGYQHVICVYMPDVYDKEDVTVVMRVLLRQHGLNLSGVKSDLYTVIGLDSKHSSGIPSTVWKNTSLMTILEIKELKEAYYTASKAATSSKAKNSRPEGRSRPLVKKEVADDFFASDDESNSHNNEKLTTVGKK